MKQKLKGLILEKYPDFFKGLDKNFKLFAREIKKELRNEGHVIIGVTGFPNSGKSNLCAILGLLIDDNYEFDLNICFIPTAKEIEMKYLKFKPFSFFHIDEASRSMHKHKWFERVQQKINELYDTEREGHFLCTALIMPRFQNFTENFRNFMIKYWINCPIRGIAIFYKRDEDKDCKDPWHIDESYKKKKKKFRSKRVFERTLPDQIRGEQITDCYWFYCKIPPIPKDVWIKYQRLKAESRVISKEANLEVEGYKDKLNREKQERWGAIIKLREQGKTDGEIAVLIGKSKTTIKRDIKEMLIYNKLKGEIKELGLNKTHLITPNNKYNIFNQNEVKNKIEVPKEFNKISEK